MQINRIHSRHIDYLSLTKLNLKLSFAQNGKDLASKLYNLTLNSAENAIIFIPSDEPSGNSAKLLHYHVIIEESHD